MASSPALIAFESREAMAARLADLVEAALGRALEARGAASLAVSGGASPAGLYAALSRRRLDWARVTAALVDERWVPPTSEGSNERFIRETLARHEAAAARLVGLWSATTPAQGLRAAEARLPKGFDVVLLGMGEDGHAASWFPHAEGLRDALSKEARLAVVTTGGAYRQRMTLTLGAVASAPLVILLIAGEAKRRAFEEARRAGPVEDAPVRAILQERPDLWVAWAP
ncbi:MAG: 6-phosphogluconolactonase [Amphiplicatus sp.]